MASTIIQQLQNSALVVTIPKALAEAMDLKKGQEMDWKLDKDRLYIVAHKNR